MPAYLISRARSSACSSFKESREISSLTGTSARDFFGDHFANGSNFLSFGHC
jgi:hypothetical protein